MSADRRHACDVCGGLGAASRWGQAMGEALPAEPPGEFHRLQQVSENRCRCPQCGNLYEHIASSQSFLNSDYDSASVRRLGPREYSEADRQAAYDRLAADLADPDAAVKSAAATVLAHDALDRPEDLRRQLLDPPDDVVRATTLRVLAVHLPQLAPLEPCLRGLAGEAHGAAPSAALHLLFRFLVFAGRRAEAVAMLDGVQDAEAGPLLRTLAASADETNVELLLPTLRRVLRSTANADDTDATLHRLLDNRTRQPVLSALLEWQEQGDDLHLGTQAITALAESIGRPEHGAASLLLLQAVVARGASLWFTFPAFLASMRQTPGWDSRQRGRDLHDHLMRTDADFDPLVRWLALVVREKPAECLELLTDILERGQNIASARKAIAALSKGGERVPIEARQAADALLTRMKHPPSANGKRLLARLERGMTVGGGATTDSQWELFFKDGRFFISGNSGDGAPSEVSRSHALAILSRKRYQWTSNRQIRSAREQPK